MRIGIATWYEGNYGSNLQAYALQVLLSDIGHGLIFLQYDADDSTFSKMVVRLRIIKITPTASSHAAALRGFLAIRADQAVFNNRRAAMRDSAKRNLVLSERCYARSDFTETVCGVVV